MACAARSQIAAFSSGLASHRIGRKPRKWLTAIAVTWIALGAVATSLAQPRALTVAETARIEKLIADMTLEEKLGQITLLSAGFHDPNTHQRWARDDFAREIRAGRLGGMYSIHKAEQVDAAQKIALEESRLKIPLIFGNDVIHGFQTTFPIPLAEACSWDLPLIEKSARIAAAEARAAGTRWTFAPMVDIARDPRWGRIAEGAGEDPYLGGLIAAARVRGFQGDDPASPGHLLACAKHYVAYGGAEGGRDYNTVDISERTLREVYLPPFKAAVDAGVGSIMSAFNEISGVPASANRFTLTDVLRGEWHFAGMVVSDYDSIGELRAHGIAADVPAAARAALVAGVDMDMCSLAYLTLAPAVDAKQLDVAVVDEAVRRVLRAKTWAGMFDQPYAGESPPMPKGYVPELDHAARAMACHSIVLLKNDGGVLPLSKDLKRIAVIGPLADDAKSPFGTWASVGDDARASTVLAAIREQLGDGATVTHAQGCAINDDNRSGIAAAVDAARNADVAIVVLGEDDDMSGESNCRTSLDLPGVQEELLEAVYATGTPTVLLILAGRPLSVTWAAEHVPAIVQAWHLGQESGSAVAEVLFGDFNPCGRLVVSIPRGVGQVPVYYAHKSTGRPRDEKDHFTTHYMDMPNTPLYPFGFGLSYTTFEYANVAVEPAEVPVDGHVTVSADVRNTGRRAGFEVVQLYAHDRVATVTRPVKQLCGFEKVRLEPGETKRVSIVVDVRSLGFYDASMKYVVEPGEFQVWIGPDSTRGVEGRFEVKNP